jgi:hypothetical protein
LHKDIYKCRKLLPSISTLNSFLKYHQPSLKGQFILRIETKETQELSNLICGELKIGLKDFILGVKTKVCQNDLAPMWHHFGAKFSWPQAYLSRTYDLHRLLKVKLP